MPSPAQRRSSSTANSTLAVFDCPYATMPSYSVSEMRVIPTDVGQVMSPRRDLDDPRPGCRAQCGQQSVGQLEVAKVIGGELRFVSAGVADQLAAHDARVVDEHVQRTARCGVAGDEGVDRGGVQQVELFECDVVDACRGTRWHGSRSSTRSNCWRWRAAGPG